MEEVIKLTLEAWRVNAGLTQKEAAKLFIDFLCDAEMGMMNFDYVYYASPLVPVVEALDEEIRSNEAIIPSKDTLEKCEIFTEIDDETAAKLNYLWQVLKSQL